MQLIIIMGFLLPEVDIDGIKEVFVDITMSLWTLSSTLVQISPRCNKKIIHSSFDMDLYIF